MNFHPELILAAVWFYLPWILCAILIVVGTWKYLQYTDPSRVPTEKKVNR